MIETETSKQVSNEQLLTDIELTGRELEAYQKIADGYRILAKLPENAGVNASLHNFQADKFRGLESECATFLKQLHALKAERDALMPPKDTEFHSDVVDGEIV